MKVSTTKFILRERTFKTAFFIFLHLFILAILIAIPNLMVSTVLAFIIYYLVEPIVDFLQDRGFSRTMAASIPFLALALFIVILSIWVFPMLEDQVDTFKAQMPNYISRIKEAGVKWEKKAHPWLMQLGETSAVDSIQVYALGKVSTFFAQIPVLISDSLSILMLTPFFSFFLLHDGKLLYRNFLKIVPNHLFELMISVNHSINLQMGQFIRARLIETALISLFLFIGMSFIDFPYSLIFSIGTGLLNLIPYLGPMIAMVPQVLLCLISPDLHDSLIPIIAINIGSQIFDGVALVPVLVAKIVDLHPVVVILAVILGGQLMGVLGMIISIPIASAFKIFITAFYKYMTHTR